MSLLLHVVLLFTLIWSCKAIIGGRPASEKEFPFVVSVTFQKKPICAGVILHLSFILSPCQCYAIFDTRGAITDTLTMYQVRVFAGTVFANLQPKEHQQYREPDLCVLHPECLKKPWIVQSDYAILRMQIPFYPSSTVQPLILRSTPDDLLRRLILKINSNALCTVVGWGRQNVKFNGLYGNSSRVLMQTTVKLIDWWECHYRMCTYPWRLCDKVVFKRGGVCAIPVQGSGSCDGDDGGALVCDSQLFGYATAMHSPIGRRLACGEIPRKPTVYARLDFAYDFLQAHSHLET